MAHCITSVAKEVLGESRGNRLTEQKETFYYIYKYEESIYINMTMGPFLDKCFFFLV